MGQPGAHYLSSELRPSLLCVYFALQILRAVNIGSKPWLRVCTMLFFYISVILSFYDQKLLARH